MNYITGSIALTLICTIIGGIASGSTGALAAFATVGIICGTGYLVRISVEASDKNRG